MASVDAATIEAGTPGHLLMARAGAGVAHVVAQTLGGFAGRRLTILCGKGNNGGDGFVVGRIARRFGAHPRIFLFATASDVIGDARHHLNAAIREGVPLTEVRDDSLDLSGQARSDDAIVDALLGTGLSGPPRGPIAAAIEALASEALTRDRRPIFAVDVPSGLNADDGSGQCAPATHTIAFGPPKHGHFSYPGRAAIGTLHLVDIVLLPPAIDSGNICYLNHGRRVELPTRDPRAHKGDVGKLVVLAGTAGTSGAALLAAQSALRTGSGLVTLGLPESLVDLAESALTEAMTQGLPEVRKLRCLSLRGRGDITRLLERADAAAIGPGLGTHRETTELVRRVVGQTSLPLVLDADGLNAFQGRASELTTDAERVLTPHPGEFTRLMGRPVCDPIEDARELALVANAVVVLKGAPSIVAHPDGRAFVNPSGNAGMATGGSGDVLTGLIAGLVVQGLDPGRAACLGTYLHGLAGDLAAIKYGQHSLVAGDILASIPEAFTEVRAQPAQNRYIQHVMPPERYLKALN